MIRLPKSAAAWNTPDFPATLKQELEATPADQLPLLRAMQQGSALGIQPFRASLLGAEEQGDCIVARVSLFFTSIIAGCNCADDPTPVDENPEYCQLQLNIDKMTGGSDVQLQDE